MFLFGDEREYLGDLVGGLGRGNDDSLNYLWECLVGGTSKNLRVEEYPTFSRWKISSLFAVGPFEELSGKLVKSEYQRETWGYQTDTRFGRRVYC